MEITRDIFIDLKAWKDCKRRKPWIVISVLQQRFGDFPTFLGKRFGDFRFFIIPVESKRFNGDISSNTSLQNIHFLFHQIKPYLFIDFLIIIWRIHIFIVILWHYGSIIIIKMKRIKAMSEKEFYIPKCSVRWTVLCQKCSIRWTFLTIKCIVHWTLFCIFAAEIQ